MYCVVRQNMLHDHVIVNLMFTEEYNSIIFNMYSETPVSRAVNIEITFLRSLSYKNYKLYTKGT